jgi:hypothetical protein
VIGKFDKVRSTPKIGGPLRTVGRVALWAVVALFLIRGAGSVLTGNTEGSAQEKVQADHSTNEAVTAFAVRYARAYLADSSPQSLTAFLAPGATVPSGGGPAPESDRVAQAEATAFKANGDGREIVTVACELVNGQVSYLAVPTVRDRAGGVAAVGAPAFVAAPGIRRSDIDPEQSQPIPGADAGAVRQLAERFTETYLSGTSAADLEYLTAPDSSIAPLGGFQPVGRVSVRQLDSPAGRVVTAAVKGESASGTVYPLTYRLLLEKRDRWYVAAIEGEVQ